MYILFLYILLGIISNSSIIFYKNKYNLLNEINNINENNEKTVIIEYIYQLLIVLLLLFNPIYYLVNNENINEIGFVLYKFNYIFHYVFLYFNFHKILKYKYLENKNFNNILCICQILILISFGINTYLTYNFKILFMSKYIFIDILLNLSELYGIFVYINSILLFILIFIKLAQDIDIVNKEIENNILSNKKRIN